MADDLTVL